MAFYQPRSRRIPEATDKRGEKIFESKTHCEVGFVLEALRSHEPGRWLGVAQTRPLKRRPKSRLVACRRDNITADAAGRIAVFPLDLPELLHDAADSG
jgi:hypothetical protein